MKATGARRGVMAMLTAAAVGALVLPHHVTVAARNGSIAGSVSVRRTAQPAARRPAIADLGSRPTPLMPERQMSVVYLEAATRGAFEQNEPGHAVMDQRNETFVPHVLAITTGTTVDFPNSDRI
jgi:hypothetical protein